MGNFQIRYFDKFPNLTLISTCPIIQNMVERKYDHLAPSQLNEQLVLIINRYTKDQNFQVIEAITPPDILNQQINRGAAGLERVRMIYPKDIEPPSSLEKPRIPRIVVATRKDEQLKEELQELLACAPHLTSVGCEIIVGDITEYVCTLSHPIGAGATYLSRTPSGGGLFDQQEAAELEKEAYQNFKRVIGRLSYPRNQDAPSWWTPLGYRREDITLLQQYLEEWRREILLNYETDV